MLEGRAVTFAIATILLAVSSMGGTAGALGSSTTSPFPPARYPITDVSISVFSSGWGGRESIVLQGTGSAELEDTSTGTVENFDIARIEVADFLDRPYRAGFLTFPDTFDDQSYSIELLADGEVSTIVNSHEGFGSTTIALTIGTFYKSVQFRWPAPNAPEDIRSLVDDVRDLAKERIE